jgi:hypothetical protein
MPVISDHPRGRNRAIARLVAVSATGVLAAALIAAAGFVLRHRESSAASPELAAARFAQLRARFAGEAPLLDMTMRAAAGTGVPAPGATRLHTVHTVVFDTRGGSRLLQIDVPYWFARRFAGRDRSFQWLGELTFLDDTEFDPEPIRLSLDQIERRGPGLLVDYRHPSGGQFLAWAE